MPLRLAVGPPKPLLNSSDKQAYQRELNTVTIGAMHVSDTAKIEQSSGLPDEFPHIFAAIGANVTIFMAKLITYLFSGSR